jgi:hypothetical protein
MERRPPTRDESGTNKSKDAIASRSRVLCVRRTPRATPGVPRARRDDPAPIDASRARVDAHRDGRRALSRSRSSRALLCVRFRASEARERGRAGATRAANAPRAAPRARTLDENRRRDRGRASTRDGRGRRERARGARRVFSRRSRARARANGRASAIVGAEEAIARIAAVRLGDVLVTRRAGRGGGERRGRRRRRSRRRADGGGVETRAGDDGDDRAGERARRRERRDDE